jgi:nickel transport protein
MMTRLAFILAALLASAAPAFAHRLVVFAAREGEAVTGYAFFVGGGRAQDAETILRDADGRELARARTDAQGAFRFASPPGLDVAVIVNAGDGHVAEAPVAGDRFAQNSTQENAQENTQESARENAQDSALARLAPADLAQIERRIEEAVARQMRPLLESQAQAAARVRFNDVMGGIGMLVGLFGAAAWAMARRKSKP